jgi:hypothetical protein
LFVQEENVQKMKAAVHAAAQIKKSAISHNHLPGTDAHDTSKTPLAASTSGKIHRDA